MLRSLSLGLLAVSLVVILAGAIALVGCNEREGISPEQDGSVSPQNTPTRDTDGAAPAVSPTAPASPTSVAGVFHPTGTATGPAEHDGARALAQVKELSAEPRVAGTPAEARAARYIAEQYASFGYTVDVVEFEFEGDRFRAGEVGVAGRTIEALTLAGSPGGTVSGAAAYVGLADDAGISGKDLNGRIAVADRGTLNFIAKYQNVKAAGAIGLVIVNHQPGPFSGNLTTMAEFPVAAVAREEGAAVLAAAKAGERLTITLPGTTGPTKALNIIARPSPNAACTVLVGGHFDSVPGAPGANDNASGSGNVIELARALAADGLDEGVCFANFGAEESGLYGSKAMVAEMEKAGALPRFMVNLDVTGIGNDVEVIGETAAAQEALSIAQAGGITAVAAKLPPNSGSDHQSFASAGVETVFLTSGDFSTIHSPQDVSADIDEKMLDEAGDLALLVIKNLLAQVARG